MWYFKKTSIDNVFYYFDLDGENKFKIDLSYNQLKDKWNGI